MTEITDKLSTALAGRYQLERHIGEGGMATVYLAEDLRHKRKVAVKVLRPELAAVLGAERFLQEITTTANLQHPHILPLFDSGEADSFLYYVMPFIDGETLRDKLNRETQLGIDEAVGITTAVADALDYAHRQGVIHRDIKPENILLHDGRPMVADFGIALALSAAAGGRMTETGLSLGTPHYMSPEQATAEKDLTNRSDIYSLGCVLYEMLTGDPPHTGSSAQQIIMKIVTDEARPVTELRKSVPPHVAAATAKSLERLPADRFVRAQDLARALTDPGFRHGGATDAAVASVPHQGSRLTLALAAATVLLTIGFGWAMLALPRTEPRQVARFDVTPGVGRALVGGGVSFAWSPDGTRFVYVGEAPNGGRQLWQRSLESLEPTPIPGTEGATNPAFSPDGRVIAFQLGQAIQTFSLPSGPAFAVAEGEDPAWGADGTLYFASQQAIYRLPPGGGQPEPVTTPMGPDQILPSALPDGRGLLLTIRRSIANQSRIAVVGPDGGAVREILDGTMARYVESGHIVYTTADGTLLAAPFDLGSLEPGPPVALVQDVRVGAASNTQFALSATGALLYQTRGPPRESELVWVSRDGVAEPVDSAWVGSFSFPALSPDGTRLAVTHQGDLWVKRLNGTQAARLTFEGTELFHPTWTPDGDSLLVDGDPELRTRRADGSGQAVPTTSNERGVVAPRWSPDGQWLVYRTNINQTGNGDILAIRPGQDSVPRDLVATEFQELSPAISPDGRWLAYTSNETGRHEVYVVPFPNTGDGKWAVSESGGVAPLWSHSGRELFYMGQGAMVAAQVEAGPPFSVGASRLLFATQGYSIAELHPSYDVAPDDRRFLMLRRVSGDNETKLILIQNFLEELKARAGN
ncbi:MAG: PD40 domain-containing protein [Gemmatimonadetes bacterium]|nr:PD40 domain-containing protein [Gemmatimonadota bacterium]